MMTDILRWAWMLVKAALAVALAMVVLGALTVGASVLMAILEHPDIF